MVISTSGISMSKNCTCLVNSFRLICLLNSFFPFWPLQRLDASFLQTNTILTKYTCSVVSHNLWHMYLYYFDILNPTTFWNLYIILSIMLISTLIFMRKYTMHRANAKFGRLQSNTQSKKQSDFRVLGV